MKPTMTFETTLGDLIAALNEEIHPYIRDEKEAYQTVGFMLAHLLKGSGRSFAPRG